MVSCSKKFLLVLIASALGTGHYAQAAERVSYKPFSTRKTIPLLRTALNHNWFFYPVGPESEDHDPVRANFLRYFEATINLNPENNPKHLVYSIEFDSNEALNYLLDKHPELVESPKKILESLAYAIENDYKKAFLRIFNDFVKDKPLFMDSPRLVIKLFILSAQMGNQEAFLYLKNRLEKLNLKPDGRKFIYLKAYDSLTRSNPGLAQQFLAEDIAQLSNR